MESSQLDKYFDTGSKKQSNIKRKTTYFPGAKKYKKGTAPITPFIMKLAIVHGQSIFVKQYAASEIVE